MDLLIVRHAHAGDKTEWATSGRPDGERPLTQEGRETMRLAAPALRCLVPRLDRIATSPLVRATETAQILSTAYDRKPAEVIDALTAGGDATELLSWLREQPPGANIALVGHNPDLEELVGWLLATQREALVRLRKGGAALVHFPELARPGAGRLQWLLTPKQMIAIARA